MQRLAHLTRAAVLLCLSASAGACNGSGGDEGGDGTTMLPATTGPADPGTTGSSTSAPPDDTGPGPGTSSSGPPDDTGPGTSSSDGGSDETSAGGEPGDWLLTVDRGSSPPRLVKVGLAGGPVEVCALPGSVDYTSLAFGRDGTLYAHNAAQNRIDRVDPCNCSFQIVGPTSLGPIVLGVAGVGVDSLFGLDAALDALVSVDVETGLATVVGPLGYIFETAALAWSDPLQQPYAVEGANDYLYLVNVGTGAATPLHPLSPTVTDPGLAVHPNDDALYVCDGNTLYGLDPSTGMMTEIGPLGLQGACRTLAAPQTAVSCVDGL